ncbi:YjjG family noncanonical pyrimidine nucleotidase [Robiginitalea sp. M366]|uniref:YjjG family noncanonical pyrimidine nucleotidase n=1 Tax=Robiginitalea aestuariiviva TaxID=3036903 RepID=UPI00240CE4FD|nr:YjjG family noncanonical pyrimidine nucleotidase [Robiginitalea aestuariiviva]MDG1572083.1 YjjG family noncanonical pyrimidine nucleotidase [Robiginitalea aestuariiviva]
MLKHPITDIFFDLDHTLWDFERNSALTYASIFEIHGVGVNLEAFLEAYIPLNLAFWKRYRDGEITAEDLRYQRLKTVFDRLGYTAGDELIHLLSEAYIDQLSTHTHLLPDALDILEYLQGSYRLHIITNGFEQVQLRKLRNSQIAGFFQEVIHSETAGVKKPHPRIFELALDRSGAQAACSVMIGDNLEADILGARQVGMQALHLHVHGEAGYGVCPVIRELREIKNYL